MTPELFRARNPHSKKRCCALLYDSSEYYDYDRNSFAICICLSERYGFWDGGALVYIIPEAGRSLLAVFRWAIFQNSPTTEIRTHDQIWHRGILVR